MTEKDCIHDLEVQAKNIKQMLDRLNLAYIGMTTEEIIRLALGNPKEARS